MEVTVILDTERWKPSSITFRPQSWIVTWLTRAPSLTTTSVAGHENDCASSVGLAYRSTNVTLLPRSATNKYMGENRDIFSIHPDERLDWEFDRSIGRHVSEYPPRKEGAMQCGKLAVPRCHYSSEVRLHKLRVRVFASASGASITPWPEAIRLASLGLLPN